MEWTKETKKEAEECSCSAFMAGWNEGVLIALAGAVMSAVDVGSLLYKSAATALIDVAKGKIRAEEVCDKHKLKGTGK